MLVLYDAETGRVMGSTIPQLIENTNTNYEDFLKDQNLDNYFGFREALFIIKWGSLFFTAGMS